MVTAKSSFLDLYHHSVRHAWNLESLLGSEWQPDFSKPFMPDPVTYHSLTEQLSPKQHLLLSQCRGCEYLAIIILIEDVIVDFFLDRVSQNRYQQSFELQQALANFITEEMKHRLLFQHFLNACSQANGFKKEEGPREALFLRFVLKHSDMGVLLFILHGEIMTYYNYLHAVQESNVQLDPFFREILRLHWVEESSHIRIDELLLKAWFDLADAKTIQKGIDDYFWLLDFLAGALRTAMTRDLEGLVRGGGEPKSDLGKSVLLKIQREFYVETFILDVLRSKRMKKILLTLDCNIEKTLNEKVKYFEESYQN